MARGITLAILSYLNHQCVIPMTVIVPQVLVPAPVRVQVLRQVPVQAIPTIVIWKWVSTVVTDLRATTNIIIMAMAMATMADMAATITTTMVVDLVHIPVDATVIIIHVAGLVVIPEAHLPHIVTTIDKPHKRSILIKIQCRAHHQHGPLKRLCQWC